MAGEWVVIGNDRGHERGVVEELHVRTEETKDVGACRWKAWPRLDRGVDKREDGGAQKVAEGGVEGLHVPQRKRGLEVGPEQAPCDAEGARKNATHRVTRKALNMSACAAADERPGRTHEAGSPRRGRGAEDHLTSHDAERVAERDAERVPRAPRRRIGPGD